MKRLKFILKHVGTPNWYQGIDKPNFWQWIYKWRISLKTANKLYKIINDKP